MESRSRKNRSTKKKKSLLPFAVFGLLALILVSVLFIWLRNPLGEGNKTAASQIQSNALSSGPLTSSSNSMASSSSGSSSSTDTTSTSPSSSSQAAWLNTVGDNKLPTMMFHNVSPQTPNNNYISPESLESILQALQANQIYTVNSTEAIQVLTSHLKPAQEMIWLTFDDGYQDFYDHVYPLLKKYNMHATSFIITGYVQNAKHGYLTPAEIQEMSNSGFVDFQSHTVDHIDLSTASDAEQTAQLQQSKAYLEQLTQKTVSVICYPSGSHNASTPGIAAGLGYQLGLLDPGRTYIGHTAVNAAATASDGLFLLNRYRTFTSTNGDSLMKTIAADEAYNVTNTQK